MSARVREEASTERRVAVLWLGGITRDTGGRTYLAELLGPLGAEPGLEIDVHLGDPEFEVPATCRRVLHRIPRGGDAYARVLLDPLVGTQLAQARYDVLLAPFHAVPPTWRGPAVVVLHNVLAFGEP